MSGGGWGDSNPEIERWWRCEWLKSRDVKWAILVSRDWNPDKLVGSLKFLMFSESYCNYGYRVGDQFTILWKLEFWHLLSEGGD